MSRETMQQALEALERTDAEPGTLAWERENEAMEALRAALAEQNDDLTAAWMAGAAEERKRAEQAQPVAWRYKPMVGSPWSLSDDGYYVSCKRDNGYIVQPLYTTPPAPVVPQSLTELPPLPEPAGKLYSYNYTADQMRDYARAVEAEVLKSMRVGK